MTQPSSVPDKGMPVAGLKELKPTAVRLPEAERERQFRDIFGALGLRQEPMRIYGQTLESKAQAMFRLDGRIVATLWRDGRTEIEDPALGKAFDGVSLHAEADARGLEGQARLDFMTDAIAQALGSETVTERWTEDAAPTRRDYLEGKLFTDADIAFGRRPYRIDPPPANASDRVKDLWLLNLVDEA